MEHTDLMITLHGKENTNTHKHDIPVTFNT